MKKGVGKVFEVREVVLVPLHDVNKAKVDARGSSRRVPCLFFSPPKIPERIPSAKNKKKAAGHGLTGRPILSTAFIPLPFPPPNLANNFISLTRESAISRNATA